MGKGFSSSGSDSHITSDLPRSEVITAYQTDEDHLRRVKGRSHGIGELEAQGLGC